MTFARQPRLGALLLVAALAAPACGTVQGDGDAARDAGANTADAACAEHARRCRGRERQFCRAGRWHTVETCDPSQICSARLVACVACEPESRRCQGDTAQRCDARGAGYVVDKVCLPGRCKKGYCITPPDSTIDVEVVITADNAYGFGYGSAGRMENYFGGVENRTAGQIFNCPIGNGPEAYIVPAKSAGAGDYLYIVAYADASTTQGVIGQFKRKGARSPVVYTAVGDWEVCATGKNYMPGSGGPSLAEINAQIARCNTGKPTPTPSGGWVDKTGTARGKLAVGEDNTTGRSRPVAGNEFPKVCGIDPQARWMWFNWDPAGLKPPKSPFIWPGGRGNPDGQFLLFRLKAEKIPGPK